MIKRRAQSSSSSSPLKLPPNDRWFDTYYPKIIQAGLAFGVWFAALASAAHDLWAASLVFALLTFLTLLLIVGHYRTNRPLQLPWLGPFTAFLGALIFSSLHSYDVWTSRQECWAWFFGMVGFYLFVNTIEKRNRPPLFFTLGSFILLPLASIALFDQVTGSPFGYGHVAILGKLISYGHWEIYATLINSIVMSGFVLYWCIFLWEYQRTERLFWLPLLSALLLLILGRSWWAFLSLSLGMAYYRKDYLGTIFRNNRSAFTKLMIGAAMMAAAIFYFKFGRHQGQHYSATNRFYWWAAALRMFFRHTLSGVGVGAYSVAYPYFHTPGVRGTLFAHSFPLQLAAETGLAGLVSIGAIITGIVLQIWSSISAENGLGISRQAVKATLMVAMVYSLISINLDYFLNKWMLLMVIGFLYEEGKRDRRLSPGLYSLATAICLILCVPFWATPWQSSRLYLAGLGYENQRDLMKARSCYLAATQLDSVYGESYAALARTYNATYLQTHTIQDLEQCRLSLSQAYRWKKDVRYLFKLRELSGLK